ncbi:MAG: GGDEF domain-containing protein [Treponema sp.]|nr:GGDEF domain-containing protein [Candidatus Treponema caballi]
MDYSKLYFFQIDVMCVIPLLSILLNIARDNRKIGMEEIFLRRIILTNVVYCLSDTVYFLVYKSGIPDSITIPVMYVTNIVYVGIPLVYSLFITKYAAYKLNNSNLTDTLSGKIIIAPLIICFLLMFSTPFTHFIFYIDGNAEYHRAAGAYLIPAVAWGYLLAVTVATAIRIMRTESVVEKDALRPLESFLVLPFITTVIQLLFYGLSVAAYGFTVSIIVFYIRRLQNQISNDDLTGLKSRAEFKRFVTSHIKKTQQQDMFVVMLDFDKFKKINDTYGHIEGDRALQNAAFVLKKACLEVNQNYVLSRYGGDEFIIVGKYADGDEDRKLKQAVDSNIQKINDSRINKFTVSLSFGFAHKAISSYQEFCTIISEADEAMYKDKLQKKQVDFSR